MRDRPETMAGRWAAKEAVSKVLGLGVRGHRLARHRDRAAADRPARGPAPRSRRGPGRAARDGADRRLDHPRIGLRGRDRLRGPDGRRPVRLPARHRGATRRARAADPRPDRAAARDGGGRWRRGARIGRSAAARRRRRPVPERGPVGFGRRERRRRRGPTAAASAPFPAGATKLDDDIAAGLIPERQARGHKGSFGKLLVIAGSLDYAGAALLVCRAAGRTGVGLVTLAVPESLQPLFAAKVVEATTMALPEDDVEEVDPEPALARILDHEHDAIVVGPGLRPGLATAELVRSLLPMPARPTPAPIVLDAEALRSMATMDGWWEGDRRPAVLTPHAGEFARLRAGSGGSPPTTATSTRTTTRAPGGRPRRGGDMGLGRRPQGRPDGHRRARRDRRHRPVREPGARDRRDRRRPGRGDRRRCWPRGSTRSPRRGSGSTSTAWPATPGVSGSATPGCSPRTCPTGSRMARKRLAVVAERAEREQAARVRGGSRPTADQEPPTRAPIQPPPMTSDRARAGRSNARLADAGLPPLPRTAWLEIDLEALRGNLAVLRELAGPGRPGPAGGQGRRLRPRGGPGRTARSRAAGADGFCVAAIDEALELRDGGVARPDPRPLPGPRRLGRARPPGSGSPCRRRPAGAGRDASAPRAPLETGRTAGRPAGGRDGARAGRLVAADLVAGRAAHRDLAGRRAGRPVDAFPGGRGRRPARRPGRAFRGRRRGRRRGRHRPAAPTRRRERRAAAGRHRRLRRRPSRAGDLRPRPGRARRRRRVPAWRVAACGRSWR